MKKTNKHIKTFLGLLIVLLLSTPVFSQKNDLLELVRKNSDLKEDIQKTIIDSVELTTKRDKYLSLISQKDSLIASIITRVSEIQSTIDPDNIADFTRRVDSLRSVSLKLDSLQKVLSAKLTKLEKQYAELLGNISSLKVYDNIKKDKIFDLNRSILTKRYSDIPREQLDRISQSVSSFSYRKDFDEYKKRVVAAAQNYDLYQESIKTLSSKYDASKVENLRRELTKILVIERDDIATGQFRLTDEQYSQLDSIDIKLARYKNGVKELKLLVASVNSDETVIMCRKNHDKEGCIMAIEDIISPNRDNTKRAYERYLYLIPFLKKMIDGYRKELMDNPLSFPGPIEQQIEKL